jgi:hypothetical protein
MENETEKWDKLKQQYPAEYKEWTQSMNEIQLLDDALSKAEITQDEYDSKKTNLDLSLFLIETAVGII